MAVTTVEHEVSSTEPSTYRQALLAAIHAVEAVGGDDELAGELAADLAAQYLDELEPSKADLAGLANDSTLPEHVRTAAQVWLES